MTDTLYLNKDIELDYVVVIDTVNYTSRKDVVYTENENIGTIVIIAIGVLLGFILGTILN